MELSSIEQYRKAVLRWNATERGVEGHLADGNSHTACALVAKAENAFTIADHNAADGVVTLVRKNMVDAMLELIMKNSSAIRSTSAGSTIACEDRSTTTLLKRS